jgi:hypothetical protein
LAVTWGWVEKAVPKVAVDDGAVEKEELAGAAPTVQVVENDPAPPVLPALLLPFPDPPAPAVPALQAEVLFPQFAAVVPTVVMVGVP